MLGREADGAGLVPTCPACLQEAMTPGATLFVRRFTAAGAVSWALIAIAVSFYALFSQGQGLSLPLDFSLVTGSAQVSSVTSQAAAAGVEPGDRVLTVDGFPAIHLARFPLNRIAQNDRCDASLSRPLGSSFE